MSMERERSEANDRTTLARLTPETREKLRRTVLTSTDGDFAIAQKVGCYSTDVQCMRRRLVMLGVLGRPELQHSTAPKQPAGTPSKYRNGDLFEDET